MTRSFTWISMLSLALVLGGVGCSDDGQSRPDQGRTDVGTSMDQGAYYYDTGGVWDTASAGDTMVMTEGGAPDTGTTDIGTPDTGRVEGGPAVDSTVSVSDGGAVTCATGVTVRIEEVGVFTPDFVVLKNTGTASAAIGGFKLVMDGINTVNYSIAAGTTLAAGAKVYLFEYSDGSGSNVINTGGNIPFYDGLSSDAVALYDSTGALVDYVAMGDKIVNQPGGTTATLWSWPTGFSSTDSVTRTGSAGACPAFLAADWSAAPSTQPSP